MSEDQKLNIPEKVMSLIRSGEVKMKPRWRFLAGTASLFVGLIGLSVTSAFLFSLAFFALRARGPMAYFRFENLISDFPWWAPFLAVLGAGLCLLLLRKFDFSYKHNFFLLATGFLIFVFVFGFALDYFGFDRMWMHKRPMKNFYERYESGRIMKRDFMMGAGLGGGMKQDNFWRNF